ncbi:MAG TPA: auracyanin family protein, partial [Planctomycetota bacterium]|nr:auracyanin family protein [Planctomycetota bacterium]
MSFLVALSLALLWQPQVAPVAAVPNESDYYAVDYLTPPDNTRVEVGGMGFLPDGRMLVSTRRGQVWLIDNALAKDPKDARFTLFAEGLQEGLGLKVVGEKIYVLQRAELSELIDNDHDNRCDEIRR